ncbi:hypothetical protein DER46DRAFT_649238 [Fusarium sp. MPI-SDFR-AT-0072]|nr:hypothetical protein DER46DRAFT_649238 [Fusarium sp. MPI-SDFR-AT-0072]
MPAISNTPPATTPNPDNQDLYYTLLGWLPIMTMPLLLVVFLFLLSIPRLYGLVRYGRTAATEGSSSSRGSASTESTSRDLPHLDAIAPPKTGKEMRRELTDGAHVSWAMMSSDMAWAYVGLYYTYSLSILRRQHPCIDGASILLPLIPQIVNQVLTWIQRRSCQDHEGVKLQT